MSSEVFCKFLILWCVVCCVLWCQMISSSNDNWEGGGWLLCNVMFDMFPPWLIIYWCAPQLSRILLPRMPQLQMINSVRSDEPFTSVEDISIVSQLRNAAILINPPKLLESSLGRYFIWISFCFDHLIRNPVCTSEWENHCEKIIVLVLIIMKYIFVAERNLI